MQRIERFLNGASGQASSFLAGGAVILMMLLTCADVAMRLFDRPIPGTYEIIGFLGTLAAAFALAATFFGSGQVALWIESMAYRRHREELLRAIRSSGFTLKRLLARIAGDGQLGKVAERLKTESARRDSCDPAC